MNMETVAVNFDLDSSNYAATLGFLVMYNNNVIVDIDHVNNKRTIGFDLELEDGDHELQFIMKNKTIDDTTVDEVGNIVIDTCLTIDSVEIDKVALGYNFIKHSVYCHDFNGNQDKIEEPFYGTMGCNGTVNFKFSSPFYIWLLENL
jgi:hypothetical protein